MNKIQRNAIRAQRVKRVIKDEGILTLLILTLQKMEFKRRKKSDKKKTKIGFLARYDDVLNARWATNPYSPPKTKKSSPYTFNWVMSPPRTGGGHQNMFRFIQYLIDQGHTCRVYLYSSHDFPSVGEIKENLQKYYPYYNTTHIEWLKKEMQPADVVFATGWETAYPVFNDKGNAAKFYFVQDFEPYFYPLGTEYVLAENTYKFNFFGITAGGWLAHKLKKDYGMQTDNYEFGANKELYRFENKEKRKEVFFYARPVTARRGFELGIMALELFHKQRPDYTITLAGWDVSDYDIPFPYENLKTLSLEELTDVYNKCAAALVVSLTNMSLMPLELLSCGAIPVVTEGPNNKEVSDNKYIKYAPPSPDGLADALIEAVDKPNLPKYAEEAAKSVASLDWTTSCEQFLKILEKQLNG
jgi:glycosyltransferase involved in cell wall biosynthesis